MVHYASPQQNIRCEDLTGEPATNVAHSLTDSVTVPRDTPIKDGIASLDSVQIKENSFLPTAFTIIALRMKKQPRIIVQIPDCSPQRKQKKILSHLLRFPMFRNGRLHHPLNYRRALLLRYPKFPMRERSTLLEHWFCFIQR